MSESAPDILAIEGKVDAVASKAVETELLSRLDGPGGLLIVDFADCAYVSSAGLRAVLIAAKTAKQKGKRLVLCGMNKIVADVFKVSGFDRMLTIVPDRAAALAQG